MDKQLKDVMNLLNLKKLYISINIILKLMEYQLVPLIILHIFLI